LINLPTPRFEIELANRAAGDEIVTRFEAREVPAVGDIITAFGGDRTKGTPFELWPTWRVESRYWHVASAGSRTAMDWGRMYNLGHGNGCCSRVTVFVWPCEGPHWTKTEKWMHARDDDEPEAADVPG
jgi:hypothetical protein